VVRVGVIGTGFGARAQIPGFRKAGFAVTAVCAARAESARQTAAEHDIPFWTVDARELARRDDVELVSVASPPYLHCEHVMAAVAAGKHVLCEKPFALDATEARRMLAAADEARVVHAVDHEFRYLPARSKLKELLDADLLGDVRTIHVVEYGPRFAQETSPLPAWWLRRDRGGGLLGAIGSHWIDTLRWWCGHVRLVAAQLAAFVPERQTVSGERTRVTADDTAELLLRLSAGSIATVQLSVVAWHAAKRVSVFGSKGTAVIDGDDRLLLGGAGDDLREIVPAQARDLPAGGTPRALLDAFASLAERIRRHIETGPAGPHPVDHPTFADGLAVQEVLDRAYALSEGDAR
jgi:predicted dehydrogenase